MYFGKDFLSDFLDKIIFMLFIAIIVRKKYIDFLCGLSLLKLL